MRRYWLVVLPLLALACGEGAEPLDPPGDGGIADSGTVVADSAVADPDAGGQDDAATPGVELNPGWIGGACSAPADCDDPNIASPVCDTSLPGGFCTQSCDGYCPDTEYGPITRKTTSRCIELGGAPRCASECDFALLASGCRAGYRCYERARYGSPTSVFPICLPEGSPGPVYTPSNGFDIGSACIDKADCTHGACLQLQGGYCSKGDCDSGGCPQGSTCANVTIAGHIKVRSCLRQCKTSADCRETEHYGCSLDGLCRILPAPTWNPSVGPGDCQSWWGTNGSKLSPCDATKDTYVVVNKAARNLALCEKGSHVKSYQVGLGYSPLGDKVRVGDAKTPEGVFYAARLNPSSSYYKAYVISYPDKADAQRGLASGLITAGQKAAIDAAQDACLEPPQTSLGSLVEIHGGTGSVDWTAGCVSITNAQMDALWPQLGLRDTIVVLP